jgi:hypothetical protein
MTVGIDGKLTISGAKEIQFVQENGDNNNVSSFERKSVTINELNGTYTKK